MAGGGLGWDQGVVGAWGMCVGEGYVLSLFVLGFHTRQLCMPCLSGIANVSGRNFAIQETADAPPPVRQLRRGVEGGPNQTSHEPLQNVDGPNVTSRISPVLQQIGLHLWIMSLAVQGRPPPGNNADGYPSVHLPRGIAPLQQWLDFNPPVPLEMPLTNCVVEQMSECQSFFWGLLWALPWISCNDTRNSTPFLVYFA